MYVYNIKVQNNYLVIHIKKAESRALHLNSVKNANESFNALQPYKVFFQRGQKMRRVHVAMMMIKMRVAFLFSLFLSVFSHSSFVKF